MNLYMKTADGSAGDELLLASDDELMPADWSRDGRFIAYQKTGRTPGQEILVLPVMGDRQPIPVVSGNVGFPARFCPNGRWIAYTSNEDGRSDVYVQSVPPSGGKWRVSTDGGSDPTWRADGRELFYLSAQGTLTSVEVATDAATFSAGAPRPLFRAGGPAGPGRNRYDAAGDGQRFLVLTDAEPDAPPQPITVVLNWETALAAPERR